VVNVACVDGGGDSQDLGIYGWDCNTDACRL